MRREGMKQEETNGEDSRGDERTDKLYGGFLNKLNQKNRKDSGRWGQKEE